MPTSSAVLDVRLLPWRPRLRVMKPDTLRESSDQLLDLGGDDLEGVLLSLVLSVALIVLVLVAAPVIVVVLAVLLLPLELQVLLLLAVVLPAARFLGVVPWTVLVLDPVTGEERPERHRFLWQAVRRVREVNHDRRVRVRWAWA